jgi:hypothetical protein
MHAPLLLHLLPRILSPPVIIVVEPLEESTDAGCCRASIGLSFFAVSSEERRQGIPPSSTILLLLLLLLLLLCGLL